MSVFGVRPEAIKMAPVVRAFDASQGMASKVVVTAQHRELLDQVLTHFGIIPDYDLNVMRPQQSFTYLTTAVLEGLTPVFQQERPDLVLVHGDTLTSFVAALAAFYEKIPVGHVEAGLRTRNRYLPFPEEMMRCLTDQVASLHFAPTQESRQNLLHDGVSSESIFVTGNTGIDALLETARRDQPLPIEWERRLHEGQPLVLCEIHRRENWGVPHERALSGLVKAARELPNVQFWYSVHPNPVVSEVAQRLLGMLSNVTLLDPPPYPLWAQLLRRATLLLTDSGGAQEEAPALALPVLLLRESTERPEALQAGTVRLVGTDPEQIYRETVSLLTDSKAHESMAKAKNPYGDGHASERIVQACRYHFGLDRIRPQDFLG